MANDRSDWEDRPPPKKSSSAWVILAIVGGVLVVSCLGCGLVAALLVMPAFQKVRDAAQRAERSNDMKQIAIAIYNFMEAKNQGPSNVNDLIPYLGGGKVEARLRSEEIKVLWNLAPKNQQIDGTSNVIFAWENQPDSASGQRLVAYMDGRVDWVPEAKFPQTPKARVK
jgi:hypothetical protein